MSLDPFDFHFGAAPPSRPPGDEGLSMHPSDRGELAQLTADCFREVFAAYGIAMSLESDDTTTRDDSPGPIVSFIGFGGDLLRGTLIILAPLNVVRASYPSELKDCAESAIQVFDWAGELANQVLGRIKNRLDSRGVEVFVSMPKVMLASHFSVPTSSRGAVCGLRFLAPGQERVGIWLDALARSSTQPIIGPIQSLSSGEGEMLLF